MVKVEGAHPLATGGGLIGEQRLVLFDRIGFGPHLCHWCTRSINWRPGGHTGQGAIVADHVDVNPANNSPSNLVPSCHSCNTWRNRADMIQPGEVVALRHTRAKGVTRTRAEQRACQLCGSAFAHPLAEKRPNRGLYCSMSCARKAPRTG